MSRGLSVEDTEKRQEKNRIGETRLRLWNTSFILKWAVSFKLRTLYPQWNIRRYSLGKTLNETQNRVDMLEHVNKYPPGRLHDITHKPQSTTSFKSQSNFVEKWSIIAIWMSRIPGILLYALWLSIKLFWGKKRKVCSNMCPFLRPIPNRRSMFLNLFSDCFWWICLSVKTIISGLFFFAF
jgi:hypothetical protein